MNYIDEIKEARYQLVSALKELEGRAISNLANYHFDNVLSYIDTALAEMGYHDDLHDTIKDLNLHIEELEDMVIRKENEVYDSELDVERLQDDVEYLQNQNARLESEIFKLTKENNLINELVGELFNKYLDRIEVSDSGKAFLPIQISCCRSMLIESLDNLIDDIRRNCLDIKLRSNEEVQKAIEDAQGWT